MAVLTYSEAQIAAQVLKLKAEAQDLRKQEQQKAWDYYLGAGKSYTLDAMKPLFKDPTKYRIVPVNLVRTLVDERAMLYKTPAERFLVGPDGKRIDEGPDVDRVTAMWDQCLMDARMKSIERYTLLQRTILVKPTWRVGDDYGDAGQMELDVIGAHLCDVIQRQDDPTRMDAFLYSISDVDTVSTNTERTRIGYVYWDAKKNLRFEADGKRRTNPENPGGVNPYGLLPAVVFRDWFAEDRFWLPGNVELVEQNEAINLVLTDIFHGLRMQTWGYAVAIGENLPVEIVHGPEQLVRIEIKPGGVGDFKIVKPEHNIEANLKVIDSCFGWIARTFHVNPNDIKLVGTVASGFALLIQKMPLLEDRQNRLELFRGYERRLFGCMRRVWNVRNPSQKISEEVRLGLDFAEVEFPQDPLQELTVLEKEIELGLVSPVDEMLRRNPDLGTREEAEKRLIQNLSERDRLKRQFNFSFGLGGKPVPAEPAEDEEEPDESEEE